MKPSSLAGNRDLASHMGLEMQSRATTGRP